jgi:hypothetical protein
MFTTPAQRILFKFAWHGALSFTQQASTTLKKRGRLGRIHAGRTRLRLAVYEGTLNRHGGRAGRLGAAGPSTREDTGTCVTVNIKTDVGGAL